MLYTDHVLAGGTSELSTKHAVRVYPTFMVFNAKGELLQRWVGFGDCRQWNRALAGVVADPVSKSERLERFEAEPNCNDAIILGRLCRRPGQYQACITWFDKAMELDEAEARKADVPIKQFRAVYSGMGTEEIPVGDGIARVTEMLNDDQLKTDDTFTIIQKMVNAIPYVPLEILSPILTMCRNAVVDIDDPEYKKQKYDFLATYALVVEDKAEEAIHLKKTGMKENWQNDAGYLNEFAWWCFESEINLDEAEELATKAVGLCAPGVERANCRDTLAQLIFLQGNRDRAISIIEEAISENPSSDYLKEQLERFKIASGDQ